MKKSQALTSASHGCYRGEKWRSLRAVWSPMFYSGSLEAYADCMHRSTDCLVAKLGAAAKAEESVDMAAELRTLALSVVGTSAFG
jgi:cytochrome P450